MKETIILRLKFLKRELRDLYWRFSGVRYKNGKLPDDPRSFLFVCKGNICRSPFAELRAAKLSEEECVKSKMFTSVGLDVEQSLPSPQHAIVAAERFGVTLTGHRSQRLSEQKLIAADMIITMEAEQSAIMRKAYPHLRHKIFLLPLFDGQGGKAHGGFDRYNIADPYGKPLEQFVNCYRRIDSCLAGLFSQIR